MLQAQAKIDYQREYMRKRRGSNGIGSNKSVRPQTIDKLRQTIRTIENKDRVSHRQPGEASLPLYNPAIHKSGDKVLVKPLYGKKLVETVIPLLDADGNPMPE